MTGSYYAYQYSVVEEKGVSVYVGQAKVRARALTHLGNSSNAKLRRLLEMATMWPLIQTFDLGCTCAGDLTILESALIADAKDRSLDNGREDRIFNCLNTRFEDWARYFPQGPSDSAGEYTHALGDTVRDTEGVWQLRSWPVCRAETTDKAVSLALRSSLDAASPAGIAGQPQGFGFLPPPLSKIIRWDVSDLRAALDLAGVGNALIVRVNDKKLSDGRADLGPASGEEAIADRCTRVWPLSVAMAKGFRDQPPDCVVAVVGGTSFRMILGGWRVEADPTSLDTGDWMVVAPLPEVGGHVLEKTVQFKQARYPVLVLRSDGSTSLSLAAKTR